MINDSDTLAVGTLVRNGGDIRARLFDHGMMPKILLVDDNVSMTAAMSAVLTSAGYDCIVSRTKTDALYLAHHYKFDVILIDFILGADTTIPESGIDLAKELRELGATAPIIGMSGYPYANVQQMAENIGMIDFLPKPFSPELLLSTLNDVLVKHD